MGKKVLTGVGSQAQFGETSHFHPCTICTGHKGNNLFGIIAKVCHTHGRHDGSNAKESRHIL